MSKSYNNTIDLFGTDKQLEKQVKGIKTDSTPVEAPKDPKSCSVFALLKLFCTHAELAEVEAKYLAGGTGYGYFKGLLLEKILAHLGPARKRREELVKDPAHVDKVLAFGAQKARQAAAKILNDCKKACGLV